MEIILNRKQIEGLADFMFDIAKGLLLGAGSSTLIGSPQTSLIIVAGLLASLCVGIALWLLKRL